MINEKVQTIVPHVNFRVRELGEWVDKNTDDYFKNKRVIVFSLYAYRFNLIKCAKCIQLIHLIIMGGY